MTPEVIAGIVRAVLASVGGMLVGKGITDDSTVQAVAGAAAVIVTAVWSVISKRKPAA